MKILVTGAKGFVGILYAIFIILKRGKIVQEI